MFLLEKIEKEHIGKIAMILAMSDESEEQRLVKEVEALSSELLVGISFIGGPSDEVGKKISQTVLSCAKKNGIGEGKSTHGLIHASIEAFSRFSHEGLLFGHLKIKIALVANNDWVAVAMYGYSSLNRVINHEKASLSINHL